MRMRKKKHRNERLSACSDFIISQRDELLLDKRISDGNGIIKPVQLEIGCGKGSFISECAKRSPNTVFIAMEKVTDVILLAAEKIKAEGIQNVLFINGDAKNLSEFFKDGEVSRIYLNFSDPWPKAGHYKRRLTYKDFLEIYKSVLTKNGEIFFKTDNRPFFDFSLLQLEESGFKLRNITNDLHQSEYNQENIVTEYEANFSAKGFTINRVEAYLENNQADRG